MPTRRALSEHPAPADVDEVLASLRRLSSTRVLDGMAGYGIHTTKAMGVSMANMLGLAKGLGRNHDLAAALWATGWYEARMVASMVDEPARVTAAQMDRWCRDFDNWGICDTVCFKLFDQVPAAWGRVGPWCGRRAEFEKRAGFALLACLALHDKAAADRGFLDGLSLIERGATDERNFVKKAVSWALRAIGGRSPALRLRAAAVAKRLAASESGAARWVGKDALKALGRASKVETGRIRRA